MENEVSKSTTVFNMRDFAGYRGYQIPEEINSVSCNTKSSGFGIRRPENLSFSLCMWVLSVRS